MNFPLNVFSLYQAIAFHRMNEKQSRNFLHQLTLARRSVEGSKVDVHREVLASPVAHDVPFPAVILLDKNGGPSARKRSEEQKPHEYEDIDAVADVCAQLTPSQTSGATARSVSPSQTPGATAHGLTPYRSAPVLEAESQYSVVQKKTSQASHVEAAGDSEELPPPVPKRMGAKSSDAELQYVDLRFLSSDNPAATHDQQRMKKQQKKDHVVEYIDVDTVAMGLAMATVDDATGGSKERKVPTEQRPDGSTSSSKPMKDVTHIARKISADGDYINITYPEKPSSALGKKMVDVTAVPPKRQHSKDGDYVGRCGGSM